MREEILVKPKKLHAKQMELIQKRFLYVRKALELEGTHKKLQFALRHGTQDYEAFASQVDEEYHEELKNLESFLENIHQANEPGLCAEKLQRSWLKSPTGIFRVSRAPASRYSLLMSWASSPLPKALWMNRNAKKSRPTSSTGFQFLSQIPWTKELRKIPKIVRAHHERLNGSGYPYHIKAEDYSLAVQDNGHRGYVRRAHRS